MGRRLDCMLLVCIVLLPLMHNGAAFAQQTHGDSRTSGASLLRMGGRERNNNFVSLQPKALSHADIVKQWPKCSLEVFEETYPCGWPPVNGQVFKYFEEVDRCASFVYHAQKWSKAQANCKLFGSSVNLATVKSQAYMDLIWIIRGNATTDHFWIGLNDIAKEGTWVWVGSKEKHTSPTFWMKDQPDNYQRSQDCIKIVRKEWDDLYCDSALPYVCDFGALRGFNNVDEVYPYADLKGAMFVGERKVISCKLTSTKFVEVTMKLKNRGQTTSFKSNVDGKHTVTGALGKLKILAIEDDFEYFYDKAPRCLRKYVFRITTIVTYDLEPSIECCARKKCKSLRTQRTDARLGFVEPLLTRVNPRYEEGPSPWLYEGKSNREYTCVIRLGRDARAWASAGIRTIGARNKMTEWIAMYEEGQLVKEAGVRPPDVDQKTTDVKYFRNHDWGGYVTNVTFTIKAATSRLCGARFVCSTAAKPTNLGSRVQKTTYVSEPIVIKYLPTTPKLEVRWPSSDGIVFAGDILLANCTAYVGTLVIPPTLTWLLKTKEDTYTWTTEYGYKPQRLPPWAKITQLPDRWSCPAGDVKLRASGSCARVMKEAMVWREAEKACRVIGYDLLQHIDDRQTFGLIAHALEKYEGYWIGLNDINTESDFVWLDGSKASVEDWGSWLPSDEALWYDDPTQRNCVYMTRSGVDSHHCGGVLPFVCRSPRGSVGSRAALGECSAGTRGPLVTSILELKVKPSMDGATLQCFSWKDRGNAFETQAVEGHDTPVHSAESLPFKFSYGALEPALSIRDFTSGLMITVELNCSATVGQHGTMTWTIKQQKGAYRRWKIDEKQDVSTENPSPSVTVTVFSAHQNSDIGTQINSQMKIRLTPEFHLATVTCYSYDTFYSRVPSYHGTGGLQKSHLVDLKDLQSVSADFIEWKLGWDFKHKKPLGDTGESMLRYSWIVLVIVLVLAVAQVMRYIKRNESTYDDEAEGYAPDSWADTKSALEMETLKRESLKKSFASNASSSQ